MDRLVEVAQKRTMDRDIPQINPMMQLEDFRTQFRLPSLKRAKHSYASA